MPFGSKLKAFRHSIGLTQEEMARSLGIGRTTYTNIERGSSKPTALFLNCLCATYGLDKAGFLDDSSSSPTGPHTHIAPIIEEKYNQLEDKYKAFILKQINDLLEIQNNACT